MVERTPATRREELGNFLRAQREKLKPGLFGLPGGGRRRTPGLRREEVAQLSGLSATWYSWIEQGREVSVSPAALARLATALRLGRAERAYLFDLAERRDPERDAKPAAAIPTAVLASIDAIACPAYLLDRSWTLQRWNRAAERLFAGWLDRPGDRNLLRYIFAEPAARTLICDWEERARRVVAEFRASGSAHLADPALRSLIAELRGRSPDFARLWDEQGVLGREGGARSFRHPRDGLLRFEQVSFELATHPELKLTMLVPSAEAPHPPAEKTFPPVNGRATPVVPGKLSGKPARARKAR